MTASHTHIVIRCNAVHAWTPDVMRAVNMELLMCERQTGEGHTWRMARFLASDSDRRSRCSFSRDMSSLWYSACSVFFCGGHKSSASSGTRP